MNLSQQNSETREDLGMLAVMDALADQDQVTQRELSRQTGLNLKKVNYCLHKLLEKGHVKFQRAVNNPDKRTYLYILTPAGFKAKSHLTYRFLKFTLDFYNQVESRLRHSLDEMAVAGIKKVVLCGATEAAKVVQGLGDGNGIKIVGVMDSAYKASRFEGLPVLQQQDLGEIDWDGLLITAFDGLEEIETGLRDWGIPEEKIWRLS